MKSQENNHITKIMNALEKEGFTSPLRFKDNMIEDWENRKPYQESDIKTFLEFRFEGMSNPSDRSILFALEFHDGNKGTLTASYGLDANVELFDFMKKVQNKRRNSTV